VTHGFREGRADVNRRDESGMAALQYACEGESPMSIVSLVQAGIVGLAESSVPARPHHCAHRRRVACESRMRRQDAGNGPSAHRLCRLAPA
jgi:hypothetical protein